MEQKRTIIKPLEGAASESTNLVILVGRVSTDPEFKHTAAGKTVAHFTLATDRTFTGRTGVKQTRTESHRLIVWNRLAEITRDFLTKGDRVYIEGSLRSWNPAEGNGQTRTGVVATRILMLGSNSGVPESGSSDARRTPPPQAHPPAAGIRTEEDESIPW
jgi:single-strand DNA-binding protein